MGSPLNRTRSEIPLLIRPLVGAGVKKDIRSWKDARDLKEQIARYLMIAPIYFERFSPLSGIRSCDTIPLHAEFFQVPCVLKIRHRACRADALYASFVLKNFRRATGITFPETFALCNSPAKREEKHSRVSRPRKLFQDYSRGSA